MRVTPNGYKLWRYAYRFEGKRKLLALRAYPDVPLREARQARDPYFAVRRYLGVNRSMSSRLVELGVVLVVNPRRSRAGDAGTP